MAELTALDEKLAEVLGLAQAAQAATDTVGRMEDADAFATDLDRMGKQAAETERRTDGLVDGPRGQEDGDSRQGSRDPLGGDRDDEDLSRRRGPRRSTGSSS